MLDKRNGRHGSCRRSAIPGRRYSTLVVYGRKAPNLPLSHRTLHVVRIAMALKLESS